MGLAWPSRETGPWHGDGVCTSGALAAPGSCTRRCGSALANDAVAVGRQQDLPLEHEGSSGVAPDKVVEGGSHSRVGSTVREERRRQLDDVATLEGVSGRRWRVLQQEAEEEGMRCI
jgi:hypothetical protein